MERIGKYEIRRVLGEGATSTVYLGYDPFAQSEVAIKRLHPELLRITDHTTLYHHLLLNEAALAGKLQHPHIVQIHDAVIADNDAYVVMEYVPGGTLEAFTKPGHLLPFERLVEIVFKCTRALDYAYLQGVTHRDIKPANILLVSPTGQDIKISDFGAAIFTATETTQIPNIGSPAYMSPEQVREQPIDHHTDIYSLGVVMYQLLTGHLPFQASSNYNIVYQIINSEPTRPSALRREIPPVLDAIVARAMAKDTKARYATWEAFAHDLAQAFRQKQLNTPSRDFAESEKFDTLRELPFFADFTDVEIWEVLRFSHWNTIPPEAAVMRDGDHGDFFCFLAEGELKVIKGSRILNLLTTGDCFGEMAVISKGTQTRGADIIALTESKVVTVKGDALRKASDACRMHFYQSFLEVLAGRLALANARLAAF